MHTLKQKLKNPFLYKILVDFFALLIIVIFGFIVAETILPGLVTAYLSPFLLFVLAFATIFIITLLSHYSSIYANNKPHKKITLTLLIIIFMIIVSLAGFKYNLFFNIIITIFCTLTVVLLYKLTKEMIR
jgi:hypothetical protein